MTPLLQGCETREKVDKLLATTAIEPGPKVDAIYYHLVSGCGQSRAAIAHGVPQAELSEALGTLNEAAVHARVRAIVSEHARGCSNGSDCEECTDGAVSAITKLFAA